MASMDLTPLAGLDWLSDGEGDADGVDMGGLSFGLGH